MNTAVVTKIGGEMILMIVIIRMVLVGDLVFVFEFQECSLQGLSTPCSTASIGRGGSLRVNSEFVCQVFVVSQTGLVSLLPLTHEQGVTATSLELLVLTHNSLIRLLPFCTVQGQSFWC
jgi:hypothetical protein